MSSTQVAVVGAGPVGLLTALGLAQSGVEVTVVERDEEVGQSPRALVYFYVVLRHFAEMGLLEDLTRVGTLLDRLQFIDVESGERIVQPASVLNGVSDYPYQLSLGQNRLTEILLDHLSQHPKAVLLRGREVTDIAQDADGVRLEMTGPDGHETLTAGWVVGADGANSIVRRTLDVPFRGHTWPERLIATNIRFPFDQHGYADANLVIDPKAGAVVVRIEDDLWRCTFRDPERDAAPSPKDIETRTHAWLAESLPGDNPGYELVQHSPYRIHQRCAETFRIGRILLAGDAAHITNPIGGLGLTTGFLDAFVLFEALAAVVKGEAAESVLDLYAEERRRAFLDEVSPQAVQNKQLLFDLTEPSVKAEVLEGLRFVGSNPDAGREQLLRMSRIETPSVLGRSAVSEERVPTTRRTFWAGGSPVASPAGTVIRGQIFVDAEIPDGGGSGAPVVLIHGGGGQGTDFLSTPDGRPGWAPLLAQLGHPVYVIDRPGHGRSPFHADVLGPMGPLLGSELIHDLFFNPIEGPGSHPMAIHHNQWPGGDQPGDPVYDQFLASQGPLMEDSAEQESLAAAAVVSLLEEIGPATVLAHSLGAPVGYLVADARPDLVSSLVIVEGIGPQFSKFPVDLRWGVTSAPIGYEPAAVSPDDIALDVDDSGPFPVALQVEPARRLPRLAQVPIAVVSAEASAFRWFDEPLRAFLTQAGCTVDLVRLWEHGVRGNGHGLMLELNNDQSIQVIQRWIADHTRRPTTQEQQS